MVRHSTNEIRIGTWNIGGGILGESHQIDGKPSLEYHAQLIKRFQPDVLCLQETHEYPDKAGQAEELAKAAGYDHVLSVAISSSHLEPGAKLALGILSKFPISKHQYFEFPNPGLKGTGPNGQEWILFDKGYLKAMLVVGDYQIELINAHCFPFHYFDASPTEQRFSHIWDLLREGLTSASSEHVAIAAIDLNYPHVEEILGSILDRELLYNSFNNTPTIPKGIQQDYLLYGGSATLLQTQVTPTDADHHYCDIRIRI